MNNISNEMKKSCKSYKVFLCCDCKHCSKKPEKEKQNDELEKFNFNMQMREAMTQGKKYIG